jgi:hypothetical protein
MWKDAVNKNLRSLTGHELRKVGSTPQQPVRARVKALRKENRLLRQQLRAAKAASRSGDRGTSMPADLAEGALRDLEGIPLEKLSLTDIANLEGTDKGTVGPSPKWPAHNYTDVYGAYLSPMRWDEINLLEIGLGVPGDSWDARIAHGRNEGGGGSLRTWYGYFPKARIYGADINAAPHLDNDRISTHLMDQGDPEAIAAFLESIGDVEFDVIVDDGSHMPDHQQVSLGCLFPRLKSGGLYIIEDLLTNGIGDGGRSRRSASTEAVNTRRVLKHFRRNGEFEMPHKIVDPAYVAEHIASLTFHVPRRPAPNTEAVCVIRKV